MVELELISTDDLITEMSNRFEHFVIAGLQTGYAGKDNIATKRSWKGNLATCAGLASQLQHAINEDQFKTGEPLID